jgi:drug/metabolite transporter (DMT)-like permease
LLYLISAILFSSIIIVAFKLFEKWHIDSVVAITVNYLIASSLGFWLCSNVSSPLSAPQQDWFPISIVSGAMLMAVFHIYASSVQKAGVAITSVSGKMSVVIPVLLGFLWFADVVTWQKITAIFIALAAFWLIFKKGEKESVSKWYYLLPVLLFFGNGINDSLLKIAEADYIKDDFIFFLSTAFFISLILGIVVMIIRSVYLKRWPDLKSLIAGIFLGLLNWYSTYFFLMGFRFFDVSWFIPVFDVCIVTTGALVGFFIFREKLRLINWVGIILAIFAILLLAWHGTTS